MTKPTISDRLTTRGGVRLLLRAAGVDDEARLAEFFRHVSEEDLRFRFLSGGNRVSHDQLVAMTAVDHDGTESFLAFEDGTGTLIATAMIACDAALDTGEVAIVVRSGYKQRGIGWALLAFVADYAQARGLKTIQSLESRDNRDALEVERDLGFSVAPFPGDPTLSLVSRSLDKPPNAKVTR